MGLPTGSTVIKPALNTFRPAISCKLFAELLLLNSRHGQLLWGHLLLQQFNCSIFDAQYSMLNFKYQPELNG